MKTYKCYWLERHSIVIEAESAEHAINKCWDSNYDENKVNKEMDSDIEAIEMDIRN